MAYDVAQMKCTPSVSPLEFATGRVDLYIFFSKWSAWILAVSAFAQYALFYNAEQPADVPVRHAEVQPATRD